MVRGSEIRIKKWDKKVDPAIVLQRFSALKNISKEQLQTYFSDVVAIETRVKELLEKQGVATIQIAFYLAYARELISKAMYSVSSETLRNEELAIRQKWVARGLNDNLLQQIARLFGIEPKPLPKPAVVEEYSGLIVVNLL